MPTPARTGLAASGIVSALALVVTLGVGGATAAPVAPGDHGDGDGTPSQAQVDRARGDVRTKARTVAAIRADLGSAQTALDAANISAEMAAERYNGAMWRLDQAKQALTKAKKKAAKADRQVKDQRAGIARLVVQNYRGGTQVDQLHLVLNDSGSSDVLGEYGAVHSATTSMDARYDAYRSLLSRAKVAKVKAKAARAKAADLVVGARKARDTAAAAQRDAAGRTAALEARTKALTAQLAKAQGISMRLAHTRAKALQLKAARAAAAAAAAKAARAAAVKAAQDSASEPSDAPSTSAPSSGGTGSGSGSDDPTPAPAPSPAPDPTPSAPSGGVGAAIAFAKAQIGDPYRWGATGPSSWDCSGLMLMAWKAGGKSLPRTSAMQYAASDHISRSQIQPGDLLFWGSSPGSIYHVAMYLGDGMMIQAPRTGRDVEVVSISYWISPSYYGRP